VCSFSNLGSSIKGYNRVIQYKYVVKVARPMDIRLYYDQVLVRMQNYENTNNLCTCYLYSPRSSSLLYLERDNEHVIVEDAACEIKAKGYCLTCIICL